VIQQARSSKYDLASKIQQARSCKQDPASKNQKIKYSKQNPEKSNQQHPLSSKIKKVWSSKQDPANKIQSAKSSQQNSLASMIQKLSSSKQNKQTRISKQKLTSKILQATLASKSANKVSSQNQQWSSRLCSFFWQFTSNGKSFKIYFANSFDVIAKKRNTSMFITSKMRGNMYEFNSIGDKIGKLWTIFFGQVSKAKQFVPITLAVLK